MAFMRYAKAVVDQPSVASSGWDEIRSAAANSNLSGNVFNKTASVDLNKYSPDQYLLTHCTIIASVEVDEVPNVKTGEQVFAQGRTINRPHNDYYITPDTAKYVNQNGDAWERKLLLSTFRTFIGAENYVEHVQIPELSKGKVVDAVARDLGDTVYVDILVATNRKHKELVADIESGKINTLSMGCSIQYSLCTKCGNIAADETELCSHVKYQKGNHFHDHAGKKRVIAELCGHHTDPDSVSFIEASWVANPAFKGAVLRNILNGSGEISDEERAENAKKQSEMIASSPMLAEFMESQNIDQFLRTASSAVNEELESLRTLKNEMRQVLSSVSINKQAFGDFDDEGDGEEEEDEASLETLKKEIKEKLQKDIKKDLIKDMENDLGLGVKDKFFDGNPAKPNVNNNIIEGYQAFSDKYASELDNKKTMQRVFSVIYQARNAGWNRVANLENVSNKDIVAAMYLRDRDYSKVPFPELYTCLSKVGGTQNYTNHNTFLNACKLALGRSITSKEAITLIKRAKFLK